MSTSLHEALTRQAEALEPLRAELKKQADSFAAFSRAVARSAWYKARASKAALVALLNEYAPRQARALWASVSEVLERVTLEVFSPPLEVALVSSQGPHAPPRGSDYRNGTRPHSQKEPEGLRAVPLRDITRDT